MQAKQDGSTPVMEGFIPFKGWRTWYRVIGEPQPGRLPLLVLHGGPDSPHDYLEPLEALAAGGRQIVFYDQIGCGNSGAPADPSIYTFRLFCEEIDAVRRALGLVRLHILGHSWGGMLALEYALAAPAGLASLILANTAASAPGWAAEGRRLVEELPEEARSVIKQHEAAGTTGSAEYQRAGREFHRRHGALRIQPRPDCLARMKDRPGAAVYQHMWGPSEWHVTGTIRDWDATARLRSIRIPALILAGRHDHATPRLAEQMRLGLAGSRLILFEKSGHFPHLEETGLFLQEVSRFLAEADNAV